MGVILTGWEQSLTSRITAARRIIRCLGGVVPRMLRLASFAKVVGNGEWECRIKFFDKDGFKVQYVPNFTCSVTCPDGRAFSQVSRRLFSLRFAYSQGQRNQGGFFIIGRGLSGYLKPEG